MGLCDFAQSLAATTEIIHATAKQGRFACSPGQDESNRCISVSVAHLVDPMYACL